MPSTKVHTGWSRLDNLTFDIDEGTDGWHVKLSVQNTNESWQLGVPFATEEAATKVGQAILDYGYGPPDKIKWGKPKDASEVEAKPKTRKAPPKKAKKTETAASAAGGN